MVVSKNCLNFHLANWGFMIHYWLQFHIFSNWVGLKQPPNWFQGYPNWNIYIYMFFPEDIYKRYFQGHLDPQSHGWILKPWFVPKRGGRGLQKIPKNHLQIHSECIRTYISWSMSEGKIQRVWGGKRFSIGWIYHLNLGVVVNYGDIEAKPSSLACPLLWATCSW